MESCTSILGMFKLCDVSLDRIHAKEAAWQQRQAIDEQLIIKRGQWMLNRGYEVSSRWQEINLRASAPLRYHEIHILTHAMLVQCA